MPIIRLVCEGLLACLRRLAGAEKKRGGLISMDGYLILLMRFTLSKGFGMAEWRSILRNLVLVVN